MGLLDMNNDQAMALGLLGSRMMQGNAGAGFGDALQYMGGAKERALKEQYMQAQMQNLQSEAAARQLKAQQEQAAMERAQAIQQAVPGLYRQPGMAGGAPVPQEIAGMPMFSQPMGVAPMQSTPGGFDVQQALKLRMTPEEIKAYASLDNLGKQEVARTVEGRDSQGRPVTYQFDKFGNRVGQPVEQWKAPVFEGLGNRRAAIDPVTLREQASFTIGQSPDSVASNAVTIRGQNMADARARANAEMGAIPSGYRRALNGSLEFIPGGPADPNTPKSKANLTEDQGKATGWLVQAENAWKNMQAVGLDKDGSVKSAAKPGLNDALAATPIVGGLANVLRSDDRQKYMQASSSLSEALLRAATGAGVNKDEAAQKIKEITPVFGDSDAVIQQKMAAVPLYLDSLRVRAGPGASKADSISGSSGASSGSPDWRYENGKLVRVK